MLKDVLDWFSKVKTQPLLIVFLAIAISTFIPSPGPLENPFSMVSLVIPVFIGVAHLLVIVWVRFVNSLNMKLAEHDLGSWSMLFGGSGLAFCLCVVCWYVSHHPEPIALKILGEANFLRLFTLFLLSAETIKLPRYARG